MKANTQKKFIYQHDMCAPIQILNPTPVHHATHGVRACYVNSRQGLKSRYRSGSSFLALPLGGSRVRWF